MKQRRRQVVGGDAAELGGRIRIRRERLRIAQRELALAAGLDNTDLSRIERGHRWPTTPQLLAIAAALRTSAARLLRGLVLDDKHISKGS
jgi:transcriptional regulator with XRE-family HTH domain